MIKPDRERMQSGDQPSSAGLRVSGAQVVELWGDTPFFPGPSWQLSWSLLPMHQQGLDEALVNGQLWHVLTTHFSDQIAFIDPWQANLAGEPRDRLVVRAIAALANALLQPATLEDCQPLVPVKFTSPCLVLRSEQHELAGAALVLSASLARAAYLLALGARLNLAPLRLAMGKLNNEARMCCAHALTAAQLAEARRRGIPTFLLDPAKRLYQFGTGRHSRWVSSTSNDGDSAFGAAIAQDKTRTYGLLRQLGLPTAPELRLPCDVSEQALLAAVRRIGYPCVLKPQDAEQGRGVTANISSDTALIAALTKARNHTRSGLLLQKHVAGEDYRLGVINGRLAFALRRQPPSITGNGMDTVAHLIEQENAMRRQLRQSGAIAGEIKPDDEEVLAYLAKAGLDLDSTPSAGHHIPLRGHANVSNGGRQEEIDIATIHPVIRRQCIMITRCLRLEACGIDYISNDIGQTPELSGGTYIEVNAMPQYAASRTELLMDNLFPVQRAHSIPVSTIIADQRLNSGADLSPLLDEIFRKHPDATIGLPREWEQHIRPLIPRPYQQHAHTFNHPREILLDRSSGHAIYLVTPESVLSRGLPAMTNTAAISLIPAETLQPHAAWRNLLHRVALGPR